MHLACGGLGGACNLVHGHDFAAHEYRLGEGDGSEEHVVDVVGEGFLGQQCHLGGYVLPVGAFYRLARERVLDNIELVAFGLDVEGLHRQILVAAYDGNLTLVVHVSAGEVDGRKICGEGLAVLVAGLAHLLARNHQLLVVRQRHGAAGIEGDDSPHGNGVTHRRHGLRRRLCRCGGAAGQCGGEEVAPDVFYNLHTG